jgi:peptide/nickel transport system substrate-binding protein
MKRLIFILSLVIVFSLCFSSCTTQQTPQGSTSASTSPASKTASVATTPAAPVSKPAQTTSPNTGGVLKVIWSTPGSPIGWPPRYTSVKSLKIVSNMIQTLWYMDENHVLQPVLAQSWDFAPDNKSVTFHLRKGVKFHDDTNWDAKAAKFMFDAYIKNKVPGSETWSSIEAVDDYTLRVNFSVVTSLQPYTIASVAFISPTAYEKLGEDGILWNPVGTGPFKIKEYKKDIHFVQERFANYWGNKPYLDGIEWIYTADPMTQQASMLAGNAHALIFVQEKLASDMKAKNFTLKVVKTPDVLGLFFDSANSASPFANLKVRQAVNYALNRDGYCNALGYGYWTPQYQLAWNGSWGFNPDLKPYTNDVSKAKQLLTEAGYANGFSTELLMATNMELPLYSAVQADLKNAGITVKLNQVDIGAFIAGTRVQGWNGLAVSIGGSTDVLSYLTSKFATINGKTTYRSLKIPAGMQELLDKTLATNDFNAQKALVQQISKLAYDDVMMAPIASHGEISVIAPGVNDFDIFPTQIGDWWDSTKVWLDKSLIK